MLLCGLLVIPQTPHNNATHNKEKSDDAPGSGIMPGGIKNMQWERDLHTDPALLLLHSYE